MRYNIPSMSSDLFVQYAEMADESMVRCLDAQANAIWPQEAPIVQAYGLNGDCKILDVGCGTGEISARIAALLPDARITGIDVIPQHLELARIRHANLSDRVQFAEGDAFALAYPDNQFDLTICRHVLQSVQHPEKALAEFIRVTRPGGFLHLLPEDYGMIYAHPTRLQTDHFWQNGPIEYGNRTGTSLRIGREIYTLLAQLPVTEIRIHYLTADTLRVPRPTLAAIIEAWRDGYTKTLVEHSDFDEIQVRDYFDQIIGCINDPQGYFVWHVPIVSARVPD